ncbi:cysteine desulfurase family protein [Pseudohoeflea coraliihabitans]|uniref:Cysteine desulfurase n=1 Tax=Pseudohoeflea coraliihabitans TaxID=2860393 RepID=A0ABS6WSF4_9HYPH|nr:cysteine desulfurase family protein [Pseudohoeflea sp. DP4N28-3]MBW3098887.1 cysteine desulfurase [Pseudohoeflea sp. DP4N28-3]
MSRHRAYLDYNATAPLHPDARAAMIAALDQPGNASSVHAEGRRARQLVSTARASVARLCGADPAHVVFVASATEAANHLLAPAYRMGRAPLRHSRLFVSAVEHPCVLAGGRFDPADTGILPVDAEGRIDLAAAEQALSAHAAREQGSFLLALQLANSETGVIQPVRAVADLVHRFGGTMIVDAVQAAGRIAIDAEALGADFLFLSAHKLGGPQGAGAVIARGEMLMPEPLLRGGGQEKGHRAGTENVAAIAGFGVAAEIAAADLARSSALAAKRDRIEAHMRSEAADITIYASGVERLPNTSCFALPGLKAETAQIAFDMEGIALSAGSACSSGKIGRSHVLEAMGADADLGALRLSIGMATGEAEIEAFTAAFAKLNARRRERIAGANAA